MDGGVCEDGVFDVWCTDGDGKELLNVRRVSGVFATADDVSEWDREVLAAERTTEVLEQRGTEDIGTSFCGAMEMATALFAPIFEKSSVPSAACRIESTSRWLPA